MPERELLAAGEGDYRLHDSDDLLAWMRPNLGDRMTTAATPAGRLVAAGDGISSISRPASRPAACTLLGRTARS
jgi:hypothetical protein